MMATADILRRGEGGTGAAHAGGDVAPDAVEAEGLRLPRFPMIGGDPALDLANTVGFHAGDRPWEWLRGYPALVAWGWQAGLMTEAEAETLLAAAAQRPGDAARALERVKAVRETIYRLFAALAKGLPPEPADLGAFNAALTEAHARLRVVARDGADGGARVEWAWIGGPDDFERMLWPSVRAAVELMTGERRRLVRQCAGDGCGWLFLDTSRKRNRRWCSMADCGNRAKARRHRARHKAAGEA
jgi:predicted RNA-binding Zn ribbon-like protein